MNFLTFLKESIVDVPRNYLDPTVFITNENEAPILNPRIKAQINSDIERFKRITNVKDYYIIGSILTNRYTDTSDIDVNIEMYTDEMTELIIAKLLLLIKELNGSLAGSTKHPINYYITRDTFDYSKTETVYDVMNDRWLKEPKFFDININKYFKSFLDTVSNIDLTTAELRRDIIDVEYLKTLSPKDVTGLKQLIKSKIYEINSSISYLIDFKTNFKKVRNYNYDRPMTPEEIKKFSSKNVLPTEVVYKLLQKYYYWDFINRLEEITDDKDEITLDDIADIKNAEQEFWKIKESFGSDPEIEFDRYQMDQRSALDDFLKYKYAWLSPSGTIYPCPHAKHGQAIRFIREFTDSTAHIEEANPGQKYDAALKNGWLRIGLEELDYTHEETYCLDVYGLPSAYKRLYDTLLNIRLKLDLSGRVHFSPSAYNESIRYITEHLHKVKVHKVDWKNPKAVRSHMQKMNRGMNRKNLRQVPQSQSFIGRHASWRNLGTAKKVVDVAKKASTGIWRLTPLQVKEISNKYHFFVPTAIHNIKHLGNTGIMIWRKAKGNFFLIKPGLRPKI